MSKGAITKKKAEKVVRKTMKRASAKPRKKSIKLDGEKDIKDINKQIEDIVKRERDKRLILWSGVTFFMVVIFIFWIFNLKQSFNKIESENAPEQEFEWSKITDDFGKTMDEMKENLAEIKEFAETAEEISTSTEEGMSTTTQEIFSNQEEIDELKARLKELENKLGTSSIENDVQ